MTDTPTTPPREGSLEAPFRHPLAWRDPDFYDLAKAEKSHAGRFQKALDTLD